MHFSNEPCNLLVMSFYIITMGVDLYTVRSLTYSVPGFLDSNTSTCYFGFHE